MSAPPETLDVAIGRFTVTVPVTTVPIPPEFGEWGIYNHEWERIELRAALAVFSDYYVTIGELRTVRKILGLSWDELLPRLGLSPMDLASLEGSAAALSADAKAAGVSILEAELTRVLSLEGVHEPVSNAVVSVRLTWASERLP